MKEGDSVMAGQLSGDFVLPEDKNKKLVFIAGGIGITPFRSVIKYLVDRKEKRPIILLYSNKSQGDVVYRELFDQAQSELQIKTKYIFTNKNEAVPEGALNVIDAETIKKEIPDYFERVFYISGPQAMVTSFKDILLKMGIKRIHIKTDYFPGFA